MPSSSPSGLVLALPRLCRWPELCWWGMVGIKAARVLFSCLRVSYFSWEKAMLLGPVLVLSPQWSWQEPAETRTGP